MPPPARSAPRLSAAMIVRDEEEYLGDCLASLRGLVDEVVVVDTGSRDRSCSIARAHGARVSSLRWRGDFAAARNAALDRATGDWILYIDADERARDADRAALEPLLAEPGLAALTVRFRPATGFTRYREPRLFRNLPGLRFRGVIHESHLPALREVMVERRLRVADSELAIDHLGYDRPRPDKHRRNLPLLAARLEAEPDNVYCWNHLGGTLDALGRSAEAAAAWRRGIEVVRRKAVRSELDCLPYLGLLAWLERRGEGHEELLGEAWGMFPHVPEIVWLQARQHLAAGAWDEALPLLERLAAVVAAHHTEALMGHDQRLFRVWVHDALGLCFFRLGRFADSARHHALAERGEPTLERAIKRGLAEARARRAAARLGSARREVG
jgi:tetratricopeptide (TPR) repeat protein